MTKKLTVLFLLFWIQPFLLFANTVKRLTDYGTSSRTEAIGVSGYSQDASVLFENPAAFGGHYRYSVTSFAKSLSDGESQYMAFAGSARIGKNYYGLGIAKLTSPSLSYTGENEFDEFFESSQFDVDETFFQIAAAFPVNNRLFLGIAPHVYFQDLYFSQGLGLNVDIGAHYFLKKGSVSAVAQNVISNAKVCYSDELNRLDFPFKVLLSGQYHWTKGVSVYGQLTYIQPQELLLPSVGFELSPMFTKSIFRVYGGWKRFEDSGSTHSRFSTGIGLYLGALDWQLSYEKTDNQFNQDQFGLSGGLQF